ncbi:MAG: SGNH/GDSL hydrolase family protein [Chloroflexota bacterium]
MVEISAENAFQIDFNFQQVPSALGVNIPPEAAAAMLNISVEQFTGYTEQAFAECTHVAQGLLDKRGTLGIIRKLKKSRKDAFSTIMTVGDSITTYRYGYAEILRALVGLVDPEQEATFFNHGRSGYTSTHGLEHTFTLYLAQRPDWVFLKYGANDTKCFGGDSSKLLVSIEEYTANFALMVEAYVKIGARVVLMTPTPVVESIVNTNLEYQAMQMTWDNADIQACAKALKKIAKKNSVPLVDLVSLFTVKPDPFLYCPDGLHPGPAGHRLIIEAVLKAVHSYA